MLFASDLKTISEIDEKWNSLDLGTFIPSPSLKYMKLAGPELMK